MEPPVSLFSGAIQDPQGDLEKHSIFKPVSKAEKIQQTQKIDLRITKKTLFAKTWFVQYLPHENMVFRVRLDRHFESFWLHFQGQSALQTGLEIQAETCRLSDAFFHGF